MKDNDKKVEITILNWDKYQREMKGGEKRRRSRDWVAISTDLLHDPDFVELTSEQKWLWVAMLLHAGRVGPVYKLSISSARLLFKLRAGWRGLVDFEVLRNQGFIDLRTATNKTDRTNNKPKGLSTPKKRVPKEWVLTESCEDYAVKQGMSAEDVVEQVEAFRDHEYKNSKKDWDAAWRTWCRNWKKWGHPKKQSYAESLEADMRAKGML